jgi:hypothetical protein
MACVPPLPLLELPAWLAAARRSAEGAEPGRRPTSEILATYQVAEDTMVEWEPIFPASLFTDPVRMTETEAKLLGQIGLVGQSTMKDIRDDAFATAKAAYPGNSSDEQNDGHQDAFRHAYWNALMVREFGPRFAENFASAHEGAPGNPADREAMDLFNNEVGRNIAVDNPHADAQQLATLVREAVDRGDMVVIDKNGELVYSNEIAYGQHGRADDPPGAGGRKVDASSVGGTDS